MASSSDGIDLSDRAVEQHAIDRELRLDERKTRESPEPFARRKSAASEKVARLYRR